MRTPEIAYGITPLSGPAARPLSTRRAVLALRVVAASALLITGAVHLQQDVSAGFIHVHVIGVLFMLNFVGAVAVGLGLLAPLERLLGRWADLALDALAAGGVAICLGSLAAILWAENRPLFGFREFGYRTPIVIAIAAEATGALALAALLFVRHARGAPGR